MRHTRKMVLLGATLVVALAGKTFLLGQAFPTPYDTETAPGGPQAAERVAAEMELPPGFHAQVFAAEPDVRQPIAVTTDVRGRLWVAENYTFAEMPRRWDPQLRDRVIILEDRDGDGRADERRVFWDEGRYLSGIETGLGGVWVLCAPHLLFIPDRDGDDVPDGPPEVVLEGFNNGASVGHNVVNGLKWGPDGWLYGRHGFLDNSRVGVPGTPPEQRLTFNAAIWRYHPTRRIFEVVTSGATNPWGMDFDQHGQMFFVNVNIGHLWHLVPGAYYRRSHSTGHFNPYVYESIDQTADHYHWDTGGSGSNASVHGLREKTSVQLGGGHAHTGCLIYQGGLWPKAYHHALLTCNFHGRRLNLETLHREGSGYVARHGEDFLQVKDPWFRGIDVIGAPDGNVFLVDWSDTGECHDNNGVHRSSGRIYKISYGPAVPPVDLNLTHASDERLVALLGHENDWFARAVRKVLQGRAIAGVDTSKAKRRLETILSSHPDEKLRLRALWAWHAIGASEQAGLRRLLDDTSEHVRTWAIRLLAEHAEPLEAASLSKLLDLAQSERSGLVRLFLASALPRLPTETRWELAARLAARSEDATDRQQPLMVWYGIQPLVTEQVDEALALLRTARLPPVRRLISRRLMEEGEIQPAWVDRLVAVAAAPGSSPELREDILAGMVASLRGLGRASKPAGWDALADDLRRSGSAETKRMVQEMTLIFGSGRAEAELLALVEDRGGDAAVRRQALRSLVQTDPMQHRALVERSITDRGIGQEAVRGLGRYEDEKVPALLLSRYPSVNRVVQAEMVEVLISRPTFARVLLEAIQSGRLPRSVLTPYQARQISGLGDEDLSALLAEAWGVVRATPETKRAELADLQRQLTTERLATGDLVRGKGVFAQSCGACHKLYGEGGTLGPDLTGSGRHDLHFLLEKIVDPGAMVPNELRMTIVKLRDGRTLTGAIPEETERRLVLQTPTERLPINKSDVLTREPMAGSMMPEGLLRTMSSEEIRDLFAYLMSRGPGSAR